LHRYGGSLKNRCLLSNGGFGLLEVVVASGILAIIALGTSSLLVTSQQGVQSAQKRVDANQLGTFINAIVSNPNVCALSGLVGLTPPPTIPSAGYPADTVHVPTLSYAGMKFDDSTNSLFDNGQIKISQLTYHAVQPSGNTYIMSLTLQVSVQGQNTNQPIVGGNTLAPVYFPLVATVDGTGHINGCGAIGTTGTPQIRASSVYASCTQYIYFAVPFPTGCTSVVSNISDSGYGGLHNVNSFGCSAGGFWARVTNADGSCVANNISYLAIGY
jgi:type II secretory pathway pseudopilin PulG